MPKMELLSPAGDREKLDTALAFGADAVYLSGGAFGMRAHAGNFTNEELKKAFEKIHALGKKGYVTVNILPRNADLAELPAFLSHLAEVKADGIILSDLGVLALAKQYAPGVPIHVSTQASVRNVEAARQWVSLGACRLVLARELSLPEIAEIRAGLPLEIELEAFVHGAMCVSFSGRCLLSNFMTGTRDANRGECTQPCRWQYALVEEKRPGQFFPVQETKEGTYILNAKDLCMIEHLPLLQKAGVSSCKIEGRMKSFYYAAVTTNAYRLALDGMEHNPDWVCPPALRAELDTVSHRPYSTGFYLGDTKENESHGEGGYLRACDVVSMIEGPALPPEEPFGVETTLPPDTRLFSAVLKNKCRAGEVLTLLSPGRMPRSVVVSDLRLESGDHVEEVKRPQTRFLIPLPNDTAPFSLLRR